MKKLRYVVLLLALACVSFAFSGVIGCKQQVPQVTISGFELTETSITVDAGDVVFVDTVVKDMQVTGSDGRAYEVYYDVTTKNGGYVDVSRGFFFADDTAGYVITYKVITSDNKVHSLTQDVNVVGQLTLRADYETRLYSIGDEITVVPVCNYTDPVYTITVTYNDTPVIISADNKFIAENVGWYTINIHAEATNATPADFEYTVYARDAFKEGEVESFDESWEAVRQLENYGTHGWVVKDTEEIGIKNRFGQDDTLLASTKQAMSGYQSNGVGYYFVFWLNARADREYYKSLVDQGYTYLSVWAYLDVEIDCADGCNHIVSRIRGGSAENAPGLGSTTNIMGTETLYNAKWDGAWTEFKVRLVDLTTQNDKNGSFNTSYDYYKEEWYPFIRFETNNKQPHGAMAVYIDDIYAVKEVDLSFNADMEVDADVNETVDFADYVNTANLPADAELIYSISVNGGAYEVLDGSTYTIPAIGSYKVKVSFANLNYKVKTAANATYSFIAPKGVEKGTVLVDTEKLSGTYDLNSMLTTEEAARLAGFGTLAFEMTDENGVKTNLTGNTIDLSTIKEGYYSIKGLYGEEKVPVWTAVVDFYSGSDFVWRNPESADVTNQTINLTNCWAGVFTGKNASLSVVDIANESYNADATKTGNYYRFDFNYADYKAVGNDGAWGLKVNPVHTKEYYQMFVGSDNVRLQFDYMFVKTDADATDTQWIFQYGYSLGAKDANNAYTWEGVSDETWMTGWLDLDYFLANRWDRAYLESGKGRGSILAINNNPSKGTEDYRGNFVVYLGNFRVVNSSANYINEYYLYNAETGAYELDESLSESVSSAFGATVSFNKKTIEGYAFNADHPDNVLSGTAEFGKKLVLKGYYKPVEQIEHGMRTGNTLETGINNIEKYTVDQFYFTSVLNPSESAGELNTISSLNKIGVDVTSSYADLIDADGVIDTSKLDGVYTITIETTDDRLIAISFEQYHDGVFTWNNIADAKAADLMARYDWAGDHTGDGTITAVNAQNDSTLANLLANGGYNGKANPTGTEGNYWKVEVSIPDTSNEVAGLRVYPVHTWDYYNTYWNGATVEFNVFAYDTSLPMTGKTTGYDWMLPYIVGGADAAKYSAQDDGGPSSEYTYIMNNWRTATFALTESNFARLTNQKTSGGNPHMSYFYGITDQNNGFNEGPLTYYVGNFNASMGYNTEYYTQQDDGSFALAETVFTKAKAGTTANAKLDYAIANYTYAVNAGEVLTGTVTADPVNYLTLKVYYIKTNVPYTVEHYVWSDTLGDYELRDSETLYGTFDSTVEIAPKTYENAIYAVIDGKSVVSGTVALDGSLVLKAYYSKATTYNLADADGFYRADSLNLADYLNGDIVSVSVTQYVVTSEGNVAIDVTEAYQSEVDAAGKLVDLTNFDGIFTIVAKDSNSAVAIFNFERVVEGVFTWNNIDESANDTVKSVRLGGRYVYESFEGTGSVSAVDSTDAIIAGKTGSFYRLDTSTDVHTGSKWGVTIFPAHSKGYYEALLVDGNVNIAMDWYFTKTGENPTDASWIFFEGQGLGREDADNVGPWNVNNITYDQYPNTWHVVGSGWNQRHWISLAHVVKHWSNAINTTGGGGFLSFSDVYSNKEVYTGNYSVYFGNIHALTGYNTEYYTQQDDGSFTLAKTVSKMADAGVTANAKLDYAIENYTYAQHEDEVLTGTVANTIKYITLKVFYVKSNVPYTLEHYKWNAAESKYDLYESETKYGVYNTTAEFLALNIEGYALNASAQGTVLSGTIALDGSLVLKGYYNNASQTKLGIRTGDTLDFGVGEVESYTVTQYYFTSVLNPSETAGELNTIKELTPNAVNVTANYPDLFDVNGVADTSKLDGVYTITAIGKNGSTAVIDFEQYQEGVFTWNNLDGAAGADLMSRYDWSGDHTGDGVISSVNAENDETLAGFMTNGGYNGKANPTGTEGNYWKVEASIPDTSNEVAGLRVYPVHTWDFYSTYWNGATVEFNIFAYDTSLPMTERNTGFDWMLPYIVGGADAAKYSVQDEGGPSSEYTYIMNNWRTATFALTENNFARLTNQKTSGGNPHMSYFYCITDQDNGFNEGPLTYYVGNFNAIMGYNTEYYTQQDDGSFALAETVFTKAKAGTTANAKLDYAIENYTYAVNAGEVLTGTVTADPANYLTLKVYYVKTNVPYTVEHYVWSDALSDFELADSETLYGMFNSTVAVTPKTTYAGAVFAEIEGKSVTSGVVTLDGALVLKAYYPKASTINLADADGFYRANSLNLGDYLAGDITSIEVKQSVVKANGNVAVDVTNAYAATLDTENKVIDLTSYDGIYNVVVMDSNNTIASFTFERVIDGTFTWNNLNEAGNDTVVGAGVSGIWADKASSYHNIAVQNVATDEAALAGRSGAYYKATASASDMIGKFAAKIYPVHTKAYYEALLADGEVYYTVDLGIYGAEKQWNILFSYGAGYNSGYAPNNPETYCDYGLALQYKGRNNFADSYLNCYGGRVARKLSGIVDNWDSYMKEGNGSYLVGMRSGDGETSTNVTVYFGNVHLVNTIITEYYTQNTDGTYSDTPAAKTYTYKENALGTTVNANINKAISGYAYAQNSNEFITTTAGVNAINFKVYYISTNVAYDVEIYKYDAQSAEFVKDEELSYTAYGVYGSTATISDSLVIDGYALDTSVEGTVASGVIDLTEKLVLKAYYVPAISETISGLRTDAKLDFGVGEVKEYSVKQYVVKTTNATVGTAASTIGSVSYEGVDVTARYPDLFDANGVADTSKLDGIFKITAKSAGGSISVKMFEQYTENAFVWNNLGETSVDTEIVYMYTYNREKFDTSAVVKGYKTAEEMASVTLYEGAYQPGAYWTAYSEVAPDSNSKGFAIRIFPTHTWAYYEANWNGATVTYSNFSTNGNGTYADRENCYILTPGYINTNGGGYSKDNWNYTNRCNNVNAGSFTLDLSAYVRLSCTNYTNTSNKDAAVYAGYWGGISNTKAAPITAYIGGITATMPEAQ